MILPFQAPDQGIILRVGGRLQFKAYIQQWVLSASHRATFSARHVTLELSPKSTMDHTGARSSMRVQMR